MRAACLASPGIIEVRDFPMPEPKNGQVLVRMRHASICGSDLHVVFDGFHDPACLGAPGYPGHEGVGIVVDGRSSEFAVGTPVLTVPYAQQARCYAEYQVLDASQVLALPAGAELRRMLLAQQLGTTMFGIKKFLPAGMPEERRPHNAAIIGAGSAGLFFLQQLLAQGIEVAVADLDERRLAIAERLGASWTAHEPSTSIVDTVHEATGGVGVDLVIEAAGYDVARAAAVEAARIRGTIGFFGYPQQRGNAPFPVERAFRKSLTMEWVNGTQTEPGLKSFRAAIEAIDRGTIEVDYCLKTDYRLEEAHKAFLTAREQGRGAVKIGITMPDA
jgi:L-iditol 2-dehydrogenase